MGCESRSITTAAIKAVGAVLLLAAAFVLAFAYLVILAAA